MLKTKRDDKYANSVFNNRDMNIHFIPISLFIAMRVPTHGVKRRMNINSANNDGIVMPSFIMFSFILSFESFISFLYRIINIGAIISFAIIPPRSDTLICQLKPLCFSTGSNFLPILAI